MNPKLILCLAFVLGDCAAKKPAGSIYGGQPKLRAPVIYLNPKK